jgi:hypothetical protein
VLKANDAPACQTDLHKPGLTNDWTKWSPDVGHANGKTYYWITSRHSERGCRKLYVAALVVDWCRQADDVPALYLWNQPAAEGNHTPSWDHLQIPRSRSTDRDEIRHSSDADPIDDGLLRLSFSIGDTIGKCEVWSACCTGEYWRWRSWRA